MPRVTGRGAALLAACRDKLGARAARARPRPDGGALLDFVERTALPLALAVPEERAPDVLVAAFEVGLAGSRSGLVGGTSRSPFEESLVAAAPTLAPLLAAHPGATLRGLGNAFFRLERELGPAQARTFLGTLAAAAPLATTTAELLGAGVVVAWRLGLAEAREAAIAAHAALPEALGRPVLGASSIDPQPERRFCRPGARGPLGPLTIVAEVGGFVGFGGPFARPPALATASGFVVAVGGGAPVVLFADVFGARLRPWHGAIEGPGEPVSIDAGGRVRWGQVEGRFPELSGARSVVAAGGVAAVSFATSHVLTILGRREASS